MGGILQPGHDHVYGGGVMDKIYDVFADEYIDADKIDPIAPPERYRETKEEIYGKIAMHELRRDDKSEYLCM